ncbi:MAG: DUF5916 domain-containing protein [Gemmatimonadota bacterium]
MLLLSLATAQVDTTAPTPVLRAVPARGAIRIDGQLDDPAWHSADSIVTLTQVVPREGGVPSARTIVRVLVEPDALVIGVSAEDPDPAAIVSFAKQRDASLEAEDHIRIVLDTFGDGRTGYVFAVNPSGARYDALVSERGESENDQWDGAWEARTSRSTRGWIAEIRIPARSLIFGSGLDTWGFNIERRIQRFQETDRWASPQRDYQVTRTGRAGRVTGIPRFGLGLGLGVRPALTTAAELPARDAHLETDAEPSLDVTQRVGTNLLGSLTVNTDFAETEVDARQTNLTRFPLFFPEKRTFFLEGADVFEFGLGLGTDVIPFFSRRIGLVEGQQVPLRVGAKLNGQAGSTNVGTLVVHTGALDTLAPATTMGVVRLKENVLRESSIGAIATWGDPLGRSESWLAGADFTYQTTRFHGDKNFLIGVWGLGMGRAGLVGDRSAAGIKIDYPNDLWDVAFSYRRVGDAFDPSLGFVPRPGVHALRLSVTYAPRPGGFIRQMFHEFVPVLVTELEGEWESYRVFMAPVNWRFESGDRFEFNVVPEGEHLTDPFEIAPGVTVPVGQYRYLRYRLEFESAAKRRLFGQATWWFGTFLDGRLDQLQLTAAWNPVALVTVELDAERDIGKLSAGNFTKDLVGTRLKLNFSPDLQLNSLWQYDNETKLFGSNTRLRWTFDPLGDVFLVYNHNLDQLTGDWAFAGAELLAKVQYAFRF